MNGERGWKHAIVSLNGDKRILTTSQVFIEFEIWRELVDIRQYASVF